MPKDSPTKAGTATRQSSLVVDHGCGGRLTERQRYMLDRLAEAVRP